MSLKICLCCGEKLEEPSSANPNTCADCEQWFSLEVPVIEARLSLPEEQRTSEPVGFFNDPTLVKWLKAKGRAEVGVAGHLAPEKESKY